MTFNMSAGFSGSPIGLVFTVKSDDFFLTDYFVRRCPSKQASEPASKQNRSEAESEGDI